MAYTVEEIESKIQKLEAELTGIESVSFADRSTKRRSVREIKDAIAYWSKKLARLNGRSRVAYGVATTGHDC